MLRIISLIPSATELIDCLGLTPFLVGRSHECDYPDRVKALPICTAPKFDPEGNSGEIHDRVTELLRSALSVYQVNLDVLQALAPTHIVTQAQCEVCAVSLAEVEAAVGELTQRGGLVPSPRIISLQPNTLTDLWTDIQTLCLAFDQDPHPILTTLHDRLDQLQLQLADQTHIPSVACIEWVDPLMSAGNWIPELVILAKGRIVLAEGGQHSAWLSWADLQSADPDYLIFMPCGYNLAKTRMEVEQSFQKNDRWQTLRAVQEGRVYLTDGNQYFNRPGPRLVDSAIVLAEILHPDVMPALHINQGWHRF